MDTTVSIDLEALVETLADALAGTEAAHVGASAKPTPAPTVSAEDLRNAAAIAPFIDHTLLSAGATRADVETLCRQAREHGFASVCVNPRWVPLCRTALAGSAVALCTVIGFPLGATAPEVKAFEARAAVAAGAAEVDMVLDLGAVRSADYGAALRDIRGVVEAAAPALVKVILETSALDASQKAIGCAVAVLAGAHFVKTSTGFGGGGATVDDVALMRRVVGPHIGVKASGGVRTAADARALIAAGATRIGASASVAIVTDGATSPGDKDQGY